MKNFFKKIMNKVTLPLHDFFYMINNTSWVKQLKSSSIAKLEVFLLLMGMATALGAIGLYLDVFRGLEFSALYYILLSPFIFLWLEYGVYFFGKFKAPLSVQEKYWKTQLWRFKDPAYYVNKVNLYPDTWKEYEKELDDRWENEFNETPAESLANNPKLIQKARGASLFIGAFSGILIGWFLTLFL